MTSTQRHIFWHPGLVSKEEREKLLHHKGAVIWFTGLSGSGKSTVARALEKALIENGHLAYVLDGDNIRHGLNKDLGFSPEDRTENIRRIGEVAALFADAGVIAITAFISPYRADRDTARKVCQAAFLEAYCECPIDVCESRDVKGLYKKARAGQLPEFTGVSAPYEAPESPEILFDSSKKSVEEIVDFVWDELVRRKILPEA